MLNWLPNEINLHIFSFLSNRDLFSASFVDQNSRKLTDEEWKRRIKKEFHTVAPEGCNPFQFYQSLYQEWLRFQSYCQNNSLFNHCFVEFTFQDTSTTVITFYDKEGDELCELMHEFVPQLDSELARSMLNELLAPEQTFPATDTNWNNIWDQVVFRELPELNPKLLGQINVLAIDFSESHAKQKFHNIFNSISSSPFFILKVCIELYTKKLNVDRQSINSGVAASSIGVLTQFFSINVLLSLCRCNAFHLINIHLTNLSIEERQNRLDLLLFEAVFNTQIELAKNLLDWHPNLNAERTIKIDEKFLIITPIFVIVLQLCHFKKSPASQLEMVNLLIEHGANLDKDMYVYHVFAGSHYSISIRNFCKEYLTDHEVDNATTQILNTIIDGPTLSSTLRLG